MQSIFCELWREAGLLLNHLNKKQTDCVLGVDFRKDIHILCRKSVFQILSRK